MIFIKEYGFNFNMNAFSMKKSLEVAVNWASFINHVTILTFKLKYGLKSYSG